MAHRPRRPRLRALAAAAVVGTILTGAAAPSAAAADPDAGWTVTPLPVAAAALSRIATGGGATFTVGFGFAGSGRDQLFVPFAAQRVGDRWVSEPAPTPDGNLQARLDDVTVLGPKDAWAVGTGVDNDAKALIEHWDGTSWKIVDTDVLPAGSGLTGVSATGPDDVWAVGYDTLPDNSGLVPLILHWDGAAWTRLHMPDPGGSFPWISSVSAAAPDDVWLVGINNLAAHYDGRTWTLTSVTPGQEVWLERVHSDAAHGTWAVGYDVAPNGTRTPAALHWDGTAWQPTRLPAEASAQLEDIAFDSRGALAAGYRMTGAGPVGYALRIPDRAGAAGRYVPVPAGVMQLNSTALRRRRRPDVDRRGRPEHRPRDVATLRRPLPAPGLTRPGWCPPAPDRPVRTTQGRGPARSCGSPR